MTEGPRVRVVSGTPGLVLPMVSRVNTAYACGASTGRPASVTWLAVAEVRGTAAPSAGVAGAVSPAARRTITAARSGSAGFVHARLMLVAVRPTTANPPTTPGAVVSGGSGVGGGIGVVGVNR